MFEYLPVEYLSVSSQVHCVLLTTSLSVLLTINQPSASERIRSSADLMPASNNDLATTLERVVSMLRLSLTNSRTVQLLISAAHSTSLLHCFSALHCRIATKVIVLFSICLLAVWQLVVKLCFTLTC